MTKRDTVLLAVISAGPRGMTPDEVADLTGIPLVTVRPAITKLKKARLVKENRKFRKTANGQPAAVVVYVG